MKLTKKKKKSKVCQCYQWCNVLTLQFEEQIKHRISRNFCHTCSPQKGTVEKGTFDFSRDILTRNHYHKQAFCFKRRIIVSIHQNNTKTRIIKQAYSERNNESQ